MIIRPKLVRYARRSHKACNGTRLPPSQHAPLIVHKSCLLRSYTRFNLFAEKDKRPNDIRTTHNSAYWRLVCLLFYKPRTPHSSHPLCWRQRTTAEISITISPSSVISAVAQMPRDDSGAFSGVQRSCVKMKRGARTSSVSMASSALIGREPSTLQAPLTSSVHYDTEPQHQLSQGARTRHACSATTTRLIGCEETSGWSPPVEFPIS
jgi:hypothetical protein